MIVVRVGKTYCIDMLQMFLSVFEKIIPLKSWLFRMIQAEIFLCSEESSHYLLLLLLLLLLLILLYYSLLFSSLYSSLFPFSWFLYMIYLCHMAAIVTVKFDNNPFRTNAPIYFSGFQYSVALLKALK